MLTVLNAAHSNNNKFLGLTLANTLYWKVHIHLTLSKQNTASYNIKMLKQTLTQETLIMIYFAYFH